MYSNNNNRLFSGLVGKNQPLSVKKNISTCIRINNEIWVDCDIKNIFSMTTTGIFNHLTRSKLFRHDKNLKKISIGQFKVYVVPYVENIEPANFELASMFELKLLQTVSDVFKDRDIPSRVYLQIIIEKEVELTEKSSSSVQDVSSLLLDIKHAAKNIKEILWDESLGMQNPQVKVASLESNYWFSLRSRYFFIRRCYEKIVSEVFRLYSLRLKGMPEDAKDRMLILGNPGIGKVCSSFGNNFYVFIYLFFIYLCIYFELALKYDPYMCYLFIYLFFLFFFSFL